MSQQALAQIAAPQHHVVTATQAAAQAAGQAAVQVAAQQAAAAQMPQLITNNQGQIVAIGAPQVLNHVNKH